MNINQTDRTDNLVIALAAAIKESKIPFFIYDASFFSGEGILEGDLLVIAKSHEDEDAIVIETVTTEEPRATGMGVRLFSQTTHKIFYPFFDKGDPSVGLEDAWIIDFDDKFPDYKTNGIVDTCLHTVNWFLNREITMRIDEALLAEEFAANHSINPTEE